MSKAENKSNDHCSATPEVNCPTCKTLIQWSEEYPFRPFCCKRCQQIDFGEWAAEQHSIPGEELPTHQDDDYHH